MRAIEPADLDSPAFAALMDEHRHAMRGASPLESQHALDLDGLRGPEVSVWVLLEDDRLLGCGALQRIDDSHAEIKAMRTSRSCLRQGVANAILEHLIVEAKRRGHSRLSLETGSGDWFLPARALYASRGFTPCAPFAGYPDDPNSAHMTLTLA